MIDDLVFERTNSLSGSCANQAPYSSTPPPEDDCPARLSAAAAEVEEISSPPDLSVTRRFHFADPDLSAAECHAPAFPATTGHDRATRELSSTQQHNNISSGPKQI